jgi:hypothetical protein
LPSRKTEEESSCINKRKIEFKLISKSVEIRIRETVILLLVMYSCKMWSLALGEKYRWRVFEGKVLKKIFGPKNK